MSAWVLIANASEARLFQTERVGAALECMKEFSHPESREKGSELTSDRPGHAQSKGIGHGAMVESSEPKDREADRFASELARELNKGRMAKAFRKLVLVAAPRFYGRLNNHLDGNTRAMVTNNIQKDFTAYDARDLPGRLKECVNR